MSPQTSIDLQGGAESERDEIRERLQCVPRYHTTSLPLLDDHYKRALRELVHLYDTLPFHEGL